MQKTIGFILIIIICASCSQYEKRYYQNGALKSVVKIKRSKKEGEELIFNSKGDTIQINNYSQGILNGHSVQFGTDSMFFSKRILTYNYGLLHGPAYEYVNNRLRFNWNYKNNKKEGIFTAYYPDGKERFRGYFSNDFICSLIEYDKKRNVINLKRIVDYDIEADETDENNYFVHLDFYRKTNCFDTLEILYAFFEIQGIDTFNISQELFYKAYTTSNKLSLPFISDGDTGLFYVQIAIPSISNYDTIHTLFKLPFYINNKIVETRKIAENEKDGLSIVW